MRYEAGIRLLLIEAYGVVPNEHVRLVEKVPEIGNQGLIAFPVILVAGIIRKRKDLGLLLAEPLAGEAQHIPVFFDIDDVLLVPAPHVRAVRGGLDVEERDPGLTGNGSPLKKRAAPETGDRSSW
jgi:hypothetical protein